jgi:hypothetical protein
MKKKVQTQLGLIEIPKKHDLCPQSGFRQSAYLQETCLYLGQSEIFSQSEELLERLCGIKQSDKQIENLCHHYGEKLEKKSIEEEEVIVEKKANLHYAMVDGSYIMSRKEGWVETKLGRVFAAESNVSVSEKRKTILDSEYVGHIGSHTDFCQKMDGVLARYTNLVFIADGAKWIWKWVGDYYPNAVQILDFFHAFEKICTWIALTTKDGEQRKQLCQYMEEMLRNSQIEELIAYIESMDCKGDILEKRTALLSYLQNNIQRMDYKNYVENGYLIGSGAIESANRNVIQQRLKRSGQRWTLKGGQQVLNLRTAYLSGNWIQVIQIVKNAA